MSEPVTAVDPRYSEPNAVATPWEETRRVLETADLFWISTVRADGRPHVTPLVAIWHDGAIHFSTGTEEQKARNMRGNPHVILTTGCNTWNKGLDIVVEGDAIRITDDSELKRLAEVWTTKWDGRWKYEVRDGYFYHYDEDERKILPYSILVFKVLPTKVYAHAKGNPFIHTLHQF